MEEGRRGARAAGRLGGCGSARTLFSGRGAVGSPLTRLLSSPKGSRGERGAGGEAGRKGEQVTRRRGALAPNEPGPRRCFALGCLPVTFSRCPSRRPWLAVAVPAAVIRGARLVFSVFPFGLFCSGCSLSTKMGVVHCDPPPSLFPPAVISEIPVVGLAVLVALRRPAALAGPRVQAPGDGAGLTPRSVAGLTAASPWSAAHAARSAPQPPPRPPCRWPCPCFSFSLSRLPSPVASPCHARLPQSCS